MAEDTNKPGQPSPEELAEQALKAAQDAISGLGGIATPAATPASTPAAAAPSAAPSGATGGDSAAEAALRAAQDAIAGLTGDVTAAVSAPAAAAPAPSSVHAPAPAAAAPAPVAAAPLPPDAVNFIPPAFDSGKPSTEQRAIDLLSDVNLNVKIELGRTRMLVEDVLRLAEGCVVELDKLAGDPVDIYVNERHVARGEVLVLNDNFCVRVNEILQDVGEPLAAVAKPA